VKSVLIIDDEAAIRRVLARVLERAGFIVRTAENGDDALQQLRAAEVDIVITDIIMPKMHGVDAIKKIVKEFSRVRIVAISGGGNFGIGDYKPDAITTCAYLAAARKAGAHALLTKPFQTAEVLHAIHLATRDTGPY
jgi:two-component system response regulator AtoC